jgi:subtilisin family serine protease
VIGQGHSLGAKALGRASRAANAVALSIPASRLTDLTKIDGVVSVKPVARYEVTQDPGGSGSLAQAADYLQVNPVREQGFDGTGVKVAVLDSGVDFTHEYLGGPGTGRGVQQPASAQNAGRPERASAPTSSARTRRRSRAAPTSSARSGTARATRRRWRRTRTRSTSRATAPTSPTSPPAAAPDGTHKGIAPGADLYVVKVCSSVSTACSGVAMLEGIDWALDPNGDGDISDAMDVMQPVHRQPVRPGAGRHDLAIDNAGARRRRRRAVRRQQRGPAVHRRLAVDGGPGDQRGPDRAAGRQAADHRDRQGIDGPQLPAADLEHPAERDDHRAAGADGRRAEHHRGLRGGGLRQASRPVRVALIQRGTCNASLKAQNAQAAGASAVIIWNNVPGDPPDFSFGGGAAVTIPTYTISQADGQRLLAADQGRHGHRHDRPGEHTSLTNTTVGTSSRGPAISGIRPKPDIGAPGAWLSAEVGTGNGQTNFSGTSGAAPVITGAAALVLDKFPKTTPAIVKARLLNAASTENRTPDAQANLYPTPVTRIGAGEVRVAPALTNSGVLLNKALGSGNVGFGLPHVTKETTFTAGLSIRNGGSTAKRYLLASTFREPRTRTPASP